MERLVEEQQQLRKLVRIPDIPAEWPGSTVVFAFDVQYVDQSHAFVAVDIGTLDGEQLGTVLHRTCAPTDYVSHFFCFREGPPLLEAFCKATQAYTPGLLVVDGHGSAHPREFGVACWLGVKTGVPTVGIAKESLLPFDLSRLPTGRGSTLPLSIEDRVVGMVLRTQDCVKPVYVSPGHEVTLSDCVALTLAMTQKFRVCEPLRRADHAARQFAKDFGMH